MSAAYHHPNPHFLPTRLLFYRFVEDDVEEYLIHTLFIQHLAFPFAHYTPGQLVIDIEFGM